MKAVSNVVFCASGSAVEHLLAKERVAGSIPVSRFFFLLNAVSWSYIGFMALFYIFVSLIGNIMKETFKKGFGKFKDVVKKTNDLPLWRWVLVCFLTALLLEFVLEILGRRSPISAVLFVIHSPLAFVYNIFLVFFTLLLGLLLKKRVFMVGFIAFLWLVMGTINFFVLGHRITPFSFIDFLMVSDVMSMLDVYFKTYQQFLIFFGIFAVITLLVFAFIKMPKIRGSVHYITTILICFAAFGVLYVMTVLSLKTDIISDDFSNLGTAYKDYGFAYCFSNSVIDVGIGKPQDYSAQRIGNIESDIEKTSVYKKQMKDKPDIIVIQLESFIDIERVEGVNVDRESIPNFRNFCNKYPSGYLTVPAIGAGTANTEFEILTGMNSKDFGAGEYPYKTILTEKPCESLAHILKSQGYGTHAIHNNRAKFYSRDEVYPNLGFDTFTSLEYMTHIERTETNWAKDSILVDEILKALDSTPEKDFVFTVSVQGHGKYPKEELKCDEHVVVTRDDEDPELTNQFGYFVNQCYEMDQMIRNLKNRLDKRRGNYILFLYGDHIPALEFSDGQFKEGEINQTEYVIINNMNLDIPDRDIYTYEFSDILLTSLGYDRGVMQKTHNRYITLLHQNEDYKGAQLNLEYDMLYGENYIYSYIDAYKRTDMKMGIDDITINAVTENADGSITVTGEYFTEFSKVLINGDRYDTTYVDENALLIEADSAPEELVDGVTEFKVAQIDKKKHLLTETDTFIYSKQGD